MPKPSIQGTIYRRDGQTSRFTILADSSSQWGLTSRELGDTRDLLDAMATAAQHGSDFFAEPEEEDGAVTVTPEQIDEFKALLVKAREAAEGDSNDEEFDALNDALDEACSLLNIDRDELTTD